ncbi:MULTISPECIES: hypothetical protein [unclassified Haladaptatus]|uniref:DUF7857 domain-containing protein n=1 Tax=unclassified Haladaptatus TaxID=2622732 RepID=UPI00209BF35F|nr:MULTISPECIES: hypothetical protein [unclassified Haladaptatus]MCO8242522.1 hypothetical protein [Haladaptatus sp. AB643]MCO8252279.1 hypothetical protein [Haladaptatus sp. AB618]
MVTLHWTVNEENGRVETVTLVELVVENTTTVPVRIRIGNRLDGEIRPPRRNGVPEAGWDEGGFEGVVAADERRALGYAVATGPNQDSPPAEIVWTERAPRTETSVSDTERGMIDGELEIEPTATGVIRALGDARPPADVVPMPHPTKLPDAVEAWLSGIETRTERYEANEGKMGAKNVNEQTREQELRRKLEADGRTLDSVAKRVGTVRERIAAARETHSVERKI